MSLLWMDSWERWGGSTSAMTSGGYAQVANVSLTTSNVATGNYALSFTMASATGQSWGVRHVLSSAAQIIGTSFHLRMAALPNNSGRAHFMQLRTAANVFILALGVEADGQIVVRDAQFSGNIIADSDDFKLTAGGYHHIEMRVFHDATNGTIEVRVDGVTRINAIDVDTGANACGQIWIGSTINTVLGGGDEPAANLDNFAVWDTNGTAVNDFIGNKSVFFYTPNQDTAAADFLPSAASAMGFEMIDDAVPDDDTTYIYSATPGEVSEFDLEDGDASITSIAAVMLIGRSRKTDSGDGNVQMSLISGASVGAGADNPLSTGYFTYSDIFHIDPATGSAITLSAFNSMKMRFERTL